MFTILCTSWSVLYKLLQSVLLIHVIRHEMARAAISFVVAFVPAFGLTYLSVALALTLSGGRPSLVVFMLLVDVAVLLATIEEQDEGDIRRRCERRHGTRQEHSPSHA